MLSLQDREWAAFNAVDFFEPERGKEKDMASLKPGDTPLVSARKVNNGVKAFVTVPNERRREGNTVTLNNDGDGGAGLAYYQPMSFALDTHVTELRPKGQMSREAMQFVAASISKQHGIFGNGHPVNKKRLALLKAMLPVDAAGRPDWQFMEDYIREREAVQVEKCREFLMERIAEIERERESKGAAARLISLYEKTWKAFAVEEIFAVLSGKRLETRNKTNGDTPFIGASFNGNGVTAFVGNDNASKDCNVLGVSYNGAPCVAFYHPYECLFTDDVKRLHLIKHEDREAVLLFFVAVFAQQRTKYSYGYKFKAERMLRQKIMLPIDNAGEPDYAYMEAYARNLMLSLCKRQLAYLER